MGEAWARLRFVVRDLAVARGPRRLVEGLGLVLAPGEALVVTGPNGSGKTSLLKVLAGLAPPARGSARWEDGSSVDRCHFLALADALKPSLTPAENLAFWARALGGGGVAPARALEAMGLSGVSDLPVAVLSSGQRRRVALLRPLVAPRPLWLLDEPTTALDAAAQGLLEAAIASHRAEGGMVVAATHAALAIPGARTLRLAP